jgi:transcriptional regulator with GAF, ATPase, and Fis domain
MSVSDRQVWQAFVQLADTLTADFDVIDFLHTLAQRSVDLLDVSACGISLADHTGQLNLVAASTEQVRLLELSEVHTVEGPCVDAFRTRALVGCADLAADSERWPAFTAAALAAGFAAVHALPMRLRGEAIGAMSLYSTQSPGLHGRAAELGQALADVATIGILHERAFRRKEMVTEQLQNALGQTVMIQSNRIMKKCWFKAESAMTLLAVEVRAAARRPRAFQPPARRRSARRRRSGSPP